MSSEADNGWKGESMLSHKKHVDFDWLYTTLPMFTERKYIYQRLFFLCPNNVKKLIDRYTYIY